MAGTQTRHVLAIRFRQRGGDAFPWGTLWINLTGTFLIGLALALFASHASWSAWHIPVILGFLGGYTTFSTFMLESARLRRRGQRWRALGYVLLSGIGGPLLAIGGMVWGGHGV